MSLPTPRQLLTSLVNAIAAIPLPPGPGPAGGGNPLGLVPPSHRPLLTTLHVLFPGLLLPALDLLDRGLVTRAVLAAAAGDGGGGGGGGGPGQPRARRAGEAEAPPPGAPGSPGARAGRRGSGGGADGGAAAATEPAPAAAVYVVRSAAPQPHRGRHPDRPPAAAAAQAYVVRVSAWHCTCAAFAFSALPGGGGRSGAPGRAEAAGGGWEFGGLSADGTAGDGAEGVPCCKHLLACVLAERWGALRGYVVERRVGREAMAAMVADA